MEDLKTTTDEQVGIYPVDNLPEDVLPNLNWLIPLALLNWKNLQTEETSDTPVSAGYHVTSIKKGTLGDTSKIQEELEELLDAESQRCKIMELVELSDLYGAINSYLKKHHPGVAMGDLEKMSSITERAFKSGRRR